MTVVEGGTGEGGESRSAARRVQCARTSPCAHGRHMTRRLALLLAVLACAVALHRPLPPTYDDSYSDSADDLWDDFDESPEISSTPAPQPRTPPPKLKLRAKGPKVNVTVKNKSDDKKVIKTTHINIESHTNFIVTKPPVTKRPQHYVLVHSSEQLIVQSTKKPAKVVSTRRPPTTRRPTTRRPPSTRRPSTRRPETRRSTNRPKTTKSKQTKKTTCPPNDAGWLSTFFNNKKVSKAPKKPSSPGFFSRLYNWIVVPTKSWFSGSWFSTPTKPKAPVTTTTTEMPSTTQPNWFHALLATEDMDAEYYPNDASTNKRAAKKPLKKNYKGYQLLRTYPDVQWKVNELLDLQEEAQGSGLMWWTVPSLNGSTDLLVPPDLLVDVKDHLKSVKIDFDVVIWDLQKAIMYENPRMSKKQRLELEQIRGHPMTWRRYHRYADILRYLEYLQHSHSEFVELVPLGRSSEGLPLVAVKISLPSNETAKSNVSDAQKKKWKLRSLMKPAVWIDGGMHAREWIAPAVALWMINTLVEGETGKGPEMEMLKQADFYIMPVVNPDGYEHSHTHDRLWRKTRSRSSDRADDYYVGWFPWNWGQTECVGVDPDRNWDYHWGEQDSSQDACADNYAGPHPFSEPETRAVSEFLADHKGLIKVFLSLHAYSQSWLIPSSHGSTLYYPDDGILMEMGKLATSALADMFGTKYQVGTAANIRQPASGMSHDWAKARAGIKFAYHVDLRDSYGPYGFLLPGSQIVSTAKETWQAVKAIVDNLSSV